MPDVSNGNPAFNELWLGLFYRRFKHLIHEAIINSLLSGHIEITLGIPNDRLDVLIGCFCKDLIKPFLDPQDLFGLDFDIRSLTLSTTQGLVHVDGGMRQSITLALFTGSQEDSTKAGCNANRDCADLVRNHAHGVEDGHTGINLAARGVDVHLDAALRVLTAQIEQLGNDQIGNLIVNR